MHNLKNIKKLFLCQNKGLCKQKSVSNCQTFLFSPMRVACDFAFYYFNIIFIKVKNHKYMLKRFIVSATK